MRILVATDQWFPDLKGGVARLATGTAVMLSRRGHEVTVLAPRVPGRPEVARDGMLEIRRVLARTRLPLTATDVFETRRQASGLGAGRFDVAVAHASTCAAGLLTARLRIPLAYVFHSPTARELRDARPRLPLWPDRVASYGLRPPLLLLERLAARRASRVLLLSRFSEGLLLGEHPVAAGRVRMVAGGIDADFFSPGDTAAARAEVGWSDDGPLLVTARRLETRMGIEALLHAVKSLNDRRPVGLAIVGGGSLMRPLQRLVTELGLESRVRLTGRVPDGELLAWYRAADLFVLPTLAYEGFGMVTAEALATGTPVVGTPVGATPELLAPLEPGLLATGTTSAELAAAVERGLALTGPELRRRCRDYACERFAWDRAILSWESVLEEAAACRPVERRIADLDAVPVRPR